MPRPDVWVAPTALHRPILPDGRVGPVRTVAQYQRESALLGAPPYSWRLATPAEIAQHQQESAPCRSSP